MENLKDGVPIKFLQKYDIEKSSRGTLGIDEDSDIELQSFKIEKPIDFLNSFIEFIIKTTKYKNILSDNEKKKESYEIYSKLLEQQFNHSNIRINNKNISISQKTNYREAGNNFNFFYGLCHYPNSPDLLETKGYGNSESTVNILTYNFTYYTDFMPSKFRSTNELFYNFFDISNKYKANIKFLNDPFEFIKKNNKFSSKELEIFKIGGFIAKAYKKFKNIKRMLLQLGFEPMTNDEGNKSLLKTLENLEYYFNNRNDVLGGYINTKEHAVAFTYCNNKIKYCNTWGMPCLDKEGISRDLQKFKFRNVELFLLLPKDYDIKYREWKKQWLKIGRLYLLDYFEF